MSKHTPGPWDIHGDETRQDFYVHGANRICDITRPNGFYRTPAETEANARLIAAAPEMLEALRAVITWAEKPGNHGGNPYMHDFVQMAEDVIAKIEGA